MLKKPFNTRKYLLYAVLVLSTIVVAFSSTKNRDANKLTKPTVNWAKQAVQGYDMRVWLSNQMTMGLQSWDCGSGDCIPIPPHFGLEYPAGSGIEHLYGAGPWIGAIVNGVRRVSEGYNGDDARKEIVPEYAHLPREHFWHTYVNAAQDALSADKPDPLGFSGYYFNKKQIVDRRGCDDDNDGKIDEDDLDGFDNDGDWNPATDDVGADGLPDSLEVSCDGLPYDPVKNPDPWGDNYDPAQRDKCHPDANGNLPYKNNKDLYTERNGIPDHGEPHVDEDYGAISDNDLYCTATDTVKRLVDQRRDHVPMGIKVIQKSYAWKLIDGVLPFDYYFINVGRKVLRDVYVGFFADMDIGPVNVSGYYQNDYSCYMDSLRTAYIHNPIDRGSTPLGITVLKTPRPLDSLDYIFQWFDFTTSRGPGTNDSNIYSWMSGEAVGNQHIKPCQSELFPSDTRFMYSFGQLPGDPTISKFKEFKPGDTLKISIALVSGLAVDAGPNNLKENAEKALKLYSRGYIPPVSLPSPPLKAETGFKKVTLRWPDRSKPGGIDPMTVWDDSNKLAEAYHDTVKYGPNHWRIKDPPCGSGTSGCSGHVCTYVDGKPYLPGGRTFMGYNLYRSEDPGVDPPKSSFTLLKQYVLPGENFGYKTEWDSVFVDSNLVRGKRYWYVVTSFGLPDITVIPVKDPNTGAIRYDTLFAENSESSLKENLVKVDLEFSPSIEPDKVLVVPNPYRVDEEYTYENGGWEGRARDWTENSRLVKFIHMPMGEWTLRVFSLAGDVITTIVNHADVGYVQNYGSSTGERYMDSYRADRGEIEWDLLSESNRALASGVYVFTVESNTLPKQIGKFVLIR